MVTAIKPEPAWFPPSIEETSPVLELNITITFGDLEDELPWFAECQELPLTGEGTTPREAFGMLLEMADLYFQSLYETGGWDRAMRAAGLSVPVPNRKTGMPIAINIIQKGTVPFLAGNGG